MTIEIKRVTVVVQTSSVVGTSLDAKEITCVWRGKIAMGSVLWREGSGLKVFSKNDKVLFFFGGGW